MNTTEMQKQAAFDRGFQIRLQQLAAGELEKSSGTAVARVAGRMLPVVQRAAPARIRGLSPLGAGLASNLVSGAAGAGLASGAAFGVNEMRRRQMANMGLTDRLRAAFALITNPEAAARQAY